METGQLIDLFTAFGIGTIVSAIFSFAQSYKKNHLTYITQSRSEWRCDVRSIINNLLDVNDKGKEFAMGQLKTYINPYGYSMDSKGSKIYYMRDGHIWDLLDKFDFENKEHTSQLIHYLVLLLKYDWERSKKEINFRTFKVIINCFTVIMVGIAIFLLIEDYKSSQTAFGFDFLIRNAFIGLDFICFIVLLVQNTILDVWKRVEREKNRSFLNEFLLFFAFPMLYLIPRLFELPFLGVGLIVATVIILVIEFSVLEDLDVVGDVYITKVKEVCSPRSKDAKLLSIHNEIIQLEDRLYNKSYGQSNLERLERATKRKRKIIGKIRRKQRPKYYWVRIFCKSIRNPSLSVNRKRLRRERKHKRVKNEQGEQ